MALRKNDVSSALVELAGPICAAHGLELVDVRVLGEPGGSVVRVIIDREGGASPAPEVEGSGVTLSDCTAISRDLSTSLDVHDELMPGQYRLEVSSPGVERPLVKLADFERFAGREVKVQTRQRVGDRKRFHGVLVGIDGETVRIEQDGEMVELPHSEISRANLVARL